MTRRRRPGRPGRRRRADRFAELYAKKRRVLRAVVQRRARAVGAPDGLDDDLEAAVVLDWWAAFRRGEELVDLAALARRVVSREAKREAREGLAASEYRRRRS